MSREGDRGSTERLTQLSGGSKSVLLRRGIDRILDSLGKRHRRLVLLLLKDGAVETKADVMLRGNDTEAEEKHLTHVHLPKLEEAGYIEWNRTTGEISKGPRFEEIEPFLELIENHTDELPPDWP